MRTRAGIILQARFASTRLPGKALAPLGSCTVLQHCLRRLVGGGVARVVLATTDKPEDDALAAVAQRMGVGVFRGSEHDVLQRYLDAAAQFGFETIVRATGDNPAVDIQASGRLLSALRASDADYACEDGLPYGAGVEAVTAAALRRSAGCASDSADREHVTFHIKRNAPAFQILRVAAPAPLRRPDLRLTVDTPEDLEHVRTLMTRTGRDEPSLRQIIEAAGRGQRAEVA